MNKSLLTLVLLLASVCASAQVISIASARLQPIGASVTVRGIVTNGGELGKIRYMQDGTAGIAAFPNNASVAGFDAVQLGDSIEVTGNLIQFQNLLEITPITGFTILSSNHPLPAPKVIGFAQVGEALESQLVRVECVTFGGAGGTFSSAGTYDVSDGDGGQAKIYLRGQHPMINTTIPTGAVQLTTIISQFGDYQLLPRSASDLVSAPCFFFVQRPVESNLTSNSFTLDWTTNLSSASVVRYGTSPTNLNQTLNLPQNTLDHTAQLTGLQPGTIYWVQIEATHNNDVIQSEVIPYATVSNSTGEIQVYFTHTVDTQFLGAQQPAGTTAEACIDGIINKINAADQTIDVAIYNVNRDDIVDALVQAHNRGVRVRVVAALATSNPSLNVPLPFQVVFGNDIALMHNKFMAIDANSEDESWVMSGSTNWTNQTFFEDFNNNVFVQDQSLARTYVIEFEEMWGSSTATPNPANGKFGSAKRDNTPHRFTIGGKKVECWFSPTDGVTDRIIETIETADASAEFALLTFTKDEPANALVAAHSSGQVSVRGLIDNTNDNGSEYNFLLNNGVPVAGHTYSGILHHKYVVIDALQPTSDPMVLTGSHNWSFTAETQNDENTLVIHDADIARLFRAEWEQRETENPISTRILELPQSTYRLVPNPAHDMVRIVENTQNQPNIEFVAVFDVAGKQIMRRAYDGAPLNLSGIKAGSYVVKIIRADGIIALPLKKM
jgi:phosphatidylserine/phosphatidylglycerophosphate/cardiolipin synthase-like enzyme